MEQSLRTFLKTEKPILHCGATGTELMKVGGGTPGAVNTMTMPEKVYEIQKSYVDAGSKISLTNTFSMNPIYASVHVKEYDWKELNRRAVEISRKATDGRAYILGNMGPVGELLAPFGTLKPEEAYEAYRQHAEVLAECGVDGFSIQTFFHLEDMKLAVKAVRDVSDLPIMASLVFNMQGATMMGDTPEACYDALLPLGIDCLGHNCGEIDFYTLGDLLEPLAKKAVIPISACPNAGAPKSVNGVPVYDMDNGEFRRGTEYLMSKGITVLGGCCGVSVEHIRAVADLF